MKLTVTFRNFAKALKNTKTFGRRSPGRARDVYSCISSDLFGDALALLVSTSVNSQPQPHPPPKQQQQQQQQQQQTFPCSKQKHETIHDLNYQP
jgi:hypothetical protein